MNAKLTVIRGGKSMPPECRGRRFLSGYVTDTRLMGVIGMELRWDVIVNARVTTLNQIFYLDAEEYGFESYTEAYGENPEAICAERNRLIGALGGNIVPVTEAEARFILQSYVKINKKFKQSMPAGYDKYKFMLTPAQTLSPDEYNELFERICGDTDLPNYVLNYYLMRTFAKDKRGIAFLTADTENIAEESLPQEDAMSLYRISDKAVPSERPCSQDESTDALIGSDTPARIGADYQPDCPVSDIYPKGPPATMCRNTIEPFGDPADRIYLCESVVEYGNRYHIITSEIQLQDEPCRVISAKKCSAFTITSTEAAMIMNCSEFITVYDVASDSDMFLDAFSEYVATFTETAYDTGRLYIDFFDTNAHVGKREYRMNDDIRAMYYLTDYNQLLVIGYSYDAVFEAELHVTLAMMPNFMRVSRKYEFKEPIIYEFIKSNYEDFNEFLSVVSGKPEL